MIKNNLLDFFIQSQEKITHIKDKRRSLLEIREHAFKETENTSYLIKSLKTALEDQACHSIYEDILDRDYKKLFNKINASYSNSSNSFSCIFTALTEFQSYQVNKEKQNTDFAIKHGFFTQEYDIYEAKIEGFDAITIYVKPLDHFKIQYLTEIGRDYKISIIFTICDTQDLEKVMKTDCPYLMIFALNPKTFKQCSHNVIDLMTHIPSNFLAGVYNPLIKTLMKEDLKKHGAKYIITHLSK